MGYLGWVGSFNGSRLR
ncbi:hypothetical protein Goari_006237 [Gossypium aridum]|uniref:Uncharacterized protein n=1 Tax=Gossypium aridum TaxID=34290 RepID=A0A7J8XMZ9_GOSAI|nr:hypothetical protein [Gossypium aridum]